MLHPDSLVAKKSRRSPPTAHEFVATNDGRNRAVAGVRGMNLLEYYEAKRNL